MCYFSSVAYWLGDHVLLNSCITAIRERCRLTLFLMSPRFGFIKVLYQEFNSSWNFCQTYIHIQKHTYATGIVIVLSRRYFNRNSFSYNFGKGIYNVVTRK